jgi:diguanylate cyclase (GGDEF)-like protein
MARLLDIEAFQSAAGAIPEEDPLALAVTDFDAFKDFFDHEGAEAAKVAVRSFRQLLNSLLPKEVIVGYGGGDAFEVCLPRTTPEEALIQMEAIRARFAGQRLAGKGKRLLNVSIGVAARPAHGSTVSELERAALEAQQRAKREGGGRVALWAEEKMVLKSNYYGRGSLEQLSKLSAATSRTEASILREALADVLNKYRAEL